MVQCRGEKAAWCLLKNEAGVRQARGSESRSSRKTARRSLRKRIFPRPRTGGENMCKNPPGFICSSSRKIKNLPAARTNPVQRNVKVQRQIKGLFPIMPGPFLEADFQYSKPIRGYTMVTYLWLVATPEIRERNGYAGFQANSRRLIYTHI